MGNGIKRILVEGDSGGGVPLTSLVDGFAVPWRWLVATLGTLGGIIIEVGVVGTLVAAAIAVIRDRCAQRRDRHTNVARRFLESLLAITVVRNSGVIVAPLEMESSQLSMAKAALYGELSRRNRRKMARWMDNIAHQAEFSVPPPRPLDISRDASHVLTLWLRKPSKVKPDLAMSGAVQKRSAALET